jgi:hypothetical protein
MHRLTASTYGKHRLEKKMFLFIISLALYISILPATVYAYCTYFYALPGSGYFFHFCTTEQEAIDDLPKAPNLCNVESVVLSESDGPCNNSYNGYVSYQQCYNGKPVYENAVYFCTPTKPCDDSDPCCVDLNCCGDVCCQQNQ